MRGCFTSMDSKDVRPFSKENGWYRNIDGGRSIVNEIGLSIR